MDFVEKMEYNYALENYTPKERCSLRKKCNILALCALVLSLAIFVFTYFLFHYLSPEGGFSAVYQETPAKPYVTLFFGMWGVMFLFASIMSFMIGIIFGRKQ